MFKTENAYLVPNLLAINGDEDQQGSRRLEGLLKDTTNTRSRVCRGNKMGRCGGERMSLQLPQTKDQIDINKERQSVKQNQSMKPSKLSNLLINFDSSQEDNDQAETMQSTMKNQSDSQTAKLQQSPSPDKTIQQKQTIIPKKNGFLLEMDFNQEEEDEQEELPSSNESQNHQEQTVAAQTTEMQLPQLDKKDFLLQLQSDEQQLSENVQQQLSNQQDLQVNTNQRVVIRLVTLLNRYQSQYYLQPIPKGAVFECVVKRDRCESLLKYHLYDCFSLRNFMTIIKDEYGYLVICKQGNKGQSTPQKQTVIARIVSNFFGTEFNCTLQNVPYSRGYSYPVTEKTQNVITVEYQTNFFGLKGPRKISAYIPILKEQKHQCLNEVYQKQKKKKLNPTVMKFKNKTPKWCKEINAYVLNFGGRASVSSIKNFVLVGENEEQEACQKVLFGKFAREMFNLDIRYPFSILQGVCLAVSSFDRKLGCQ